jgi:phosphoglycerate dehydrogenase-like enzyme
LKALIEQVAASSMTVLLTGPTGSGKSTTLAVAELTVALMLALARSVPMADSAMKAGQWIKKQLEGVELNCKTLGIIGCGRIGLEVARRALVFGMKVLAYDVIPIKSDLAIRQVPLDELLAAATSSPSMSLNSPSLLSERPSSPR